MLRIWPGFILLHTKSALYFYLLHLSYFILFYLTIFIRYAIGSIILTLSIHLGDCLDLPVSYLRITNIIRLHPALFYFYSI